MDGSAAALETDQETQVLEPESESVNAHAFHPSDLVQSYLARLEIDFLLNDKRLSAHKYALL